MACQLLGGLAQRLSPFEIATTSFAVSNGAPRPKKMHKKPRRTHLSNGEAQMRRGPRRAHRFFLHTISLFESVSCAQYRFGNRFGRDYVREAPRDTLRQSSLAEA